MGGGLLFFSCPCTIKTLTQPMPRPKSPKRASRKQKSTKRKSTKLKSPKRHGQRYRASGVGVNYETGDTEPASHNTGHAPRHEQMAERLAAVTEVRGPDQSLNKVTTGILILNNVLNHTTANVLPDESGTRHYIGAFYDQTNNNVYFIEDFDVNDGTIQGDVIRNVQISVHGTTATLFRHRPPAPPPVTPAEDTIR